MPSPAPRKLVVNRATYLFRVTHRHSPRPTGAGCAEIFTAYLLGHAAAPLRILFPETSSQGLGYIRRRGVITDYATPGFWLNLNRPATARFLIGEALAAGWSPGTLRGERVEPDGYQFLRDRRERLASFLDAEATDPAGGWEVNV